MVVVVVLGVREAAALRLAAFVLMCLRGARTWIFDEKKMMDVMERRLRLAKQNAIEENQRVARTTDKGRAVSVSHLGRRDWDIAAARDAA